VPEKGWGGLKGGDDPDPPHHESEPLRKAAHWNGHSHHQTDVFGSGGGEGDSFREEQNGIDFYDSPEKKRGAVG